MPSNYPKKVNVATPPRGNTSNAKPAKPTVVDLSQRGDTGIPSTSVRMETGREAERRQALEAIQRGIKQATTPRSVGPVDTRNTMSPHGSIVNPINPSMVGAGLGVGPAAGLDPGAISRAMLQGLGSKPAPAAPAASVGQAMMSGLDPYRETEGKRVFAVPTRGQSAQQQAAMSQLSRVSSTGYSPGVLATRERQRAQADLEKLGLPPQAQAAALERIQKGDTEVVSRAAQAMAALPQGSSLSDGRIAAYVAEQLRGGDGAQEFDARRQADLGKYRQVAQRNADTARATSGKAIEMGMAPLSSMQALQAEQRRRNQIAYQSADMASLQKLAAAGDVDAARALEGTPGPWAPGSPQLGVRANTQARENEVAQMRYVAPELAKAQGQLSKQQLIQQGKSEAEANRLLIEQNKLTERQYEAQLRAAGWDSRQASQLAMQFGKTNTLRVQNGLEPLTMGDYHAAVQQLAPQGRTAPQAPSFQQPGPMGGAPAGGAGPSMPAAPAAPVAPPSAEAQAFTAEFSSLPPQEQQQVIADLEASGDSAHAAYFRAIMGR